MTPESPFENPHPPHAEPAAQQPARSPHGPASFDTPPSAATQDEEAWASQTGAEIRAAVAGERTALIDLWVAAWQAAMPDIDFDARRGWIDAHLDALTQAGAALLVAHVASRPAGFVTVDAEGRVDQLVVARACQGQGIAARLLAAARAAGAGRLRLTVNVDNPRAVRFYERNGFTIVGQGVNPRSGLPVLHMEG